MTWKPILALLALSLAALPSAAPRADEVGSAQPVVLSRQDGATMSIPRWKAYVHPTDPDRIWLALANWGGDGDQLIFSTNAGLSWQLPDIQFDPDYSLDYHLSVAGDASGNLHLVFPELTNPLLRKAGRSPELPRQWRALPCRLQG